MKKKLEKAVNPPNIDNLYKDIAVLIQQAKSNIKRTVNSEQVLLYWNIGKHVKKEILNNERAEYGKFIVEELSKKLIFQFGKGFSRSSIFRMIQFYDVFSSKEIVATTLRQFGWSKIREIIKLKDETKREFYITMCQNDNWDVRTLRNRIDSMLYERTAISKKPEKTIINDLELLKTEKKMSEDLFFRDPYILDFLNLPDTYNEKDVENAILSELEKFILEMGKDFAFVARQKRITVDDEDYFIKKEE